MELMAAIFITNVDFKCKIHFNVPIEFLLTFYQLKNIFPVFYLFKSQSMMFKLQWESNPIAPFGLYCYKKSINHTQFCDLKTR